jgi:hypothetical protein
VDPSRNLGVGREVLPDLFDLDPVLPAMAQPLCTTVDLLDPEGVADQSAQMVE